MNATSTARFLSSFRAFFGSKQGRRIFTDVLEQEIGFASSAQVGKPRNLGAGPGSFDLAMTVRALGQRLEAHFSAFRVERCWA